MYCTNCGTNAGEANFCPNCGSSIYGAGADGNIETFNLITAYKSMFKKYAQFSGRSRRSEYWLASVMSFLIVALFYSVIFIPVISDMINYGAPSRSTVVMMLVWIVLIFAYAIAVFLPSLAMTVRRLHDTGKSGLLLLLGLIPYVGEIIIFVFMFLDSQPGTNKYGPNPKGQ